MPEAKAPVRGRARVLSNEVDGPGRKLLLEMPEWPGSVPGQFVMVGAGALASVPRKDPLLPRPMAVYREHGEPVSSGRGSSVTAEAQGEATGAPRFELLYRIAGRGTALLAEAVPGDFVSLVGPLGRGFPLEADKARPALLVGGGTGIASLYELAAALSEKGRPVTVLLGARRASDLMGVSDFEGLAKAGVRLEIATENGSLGHQGFVTVPLEARLAQRGAENGGDAGSKVDVFVCGPTPMMEAAAALADRFGQRCYVSLENPMACGFGVCLGCAAPMRAGGFALVCRQGPVFEASEVNWEGLP